MAEQTTIPASAEYTVDLARPVPRAMADELARRLLFASERIARFTLVEDESGQVRRVKVGTDRPTDADELAHKINLLAETHVSSGLGRRTATVWSSARTGPAARPVLAELTARGLVTQPSPGAVAVGGAVLDLLLRLDGLLRDLAVTRFGAVEFRYPTLLPTRTLRRTGYLASFPQHVMFATRLHADIDIYREFLGALPGAAGERELEQLVLDHCDSAEYSLPPTMCYHTFQQFAQQNLDSGSAVVTARGKSFRHEGRYRDGMERLWDFTIREIVFLGPREFALSCRDRFLRLTAELFDELDLMGHCEIADDPFLGDAPADESAAAQRMLELKYEMRLSVAPDRTVAVASFNRHDRHFTEPFGIGLADGGDAHSACVGFGLERLAYAVLCQHGIDPSTWPPLLRGPVRHDEAGA